MSFARPTKRTKRIRLHTAPPGARAVEVWDNNADYTIVFRAELWRSVERLKKNLAFVVAAENSNSNVMDGAGRRELGCGDVADRLGKVCTS